MPSSDKTTITTGAWLSASIVNDSQCILAAQFAARFSGAGFQDVRNALTMGFEIESSRFIWILHHDDQHHRVTVTNIGSDNPEEVYVFDSMFSCGSTCIHTRVGSLLHTDKSQFTLKFVDVHKQDGWNDCGLFSIAYAVALIFDLQPAWCLCI